VVPADAGLLTPCPRPVKMNKKA